MEARGSQKNPDGAHSLLSAINSTWLKGWALGDTPTVNNEKSTSSLLITPGSTSTKLIDRIKPDSRAENKGMAESLLAVCEPQVGPFKAAGCIFKKLYFHNKENAIIRRIQKKPFHVYFS